MRPTHPHKAQREFDMPVTIPRTALVWKTNTPCSNAWGELCSLMTASLAGAGSHCQGHCSCHSDYSWGGRQSSAPSPLKQEQLGQSLLPDPQPPLMALWPPGHHCTGLGLLYKSHQQVYFPRGKEFNNMAGDFPSISARAACKTATTKSRNEYKQGILAACWHMQQLKPCNSWTVYHCRTSTGMITTRSKLSTVFLNLWFYFSNPESN